MANGTKTADRTEEAIGRLLDKIVTLSQRLVDMDVTPENVGFRNLLLGILNSARRDYQSVKVGVLKSPYLAAWGARNLLELRVTAVYILQSESNARELQEFRMRDQEQFWDAVIKSAVSTHPELVKQMREVAASGRFAEEAIRKAADEVEADGPPINELRAEARAVKLVMKEKGMRRGRGSQVLRERATAVGLQNIYGTHSTIYSMLVHPSALALASSVTSGSLDELMPLISSQAQVDLLATFSVIEDHVNTRGLCWA